MNMHYGSTCLYLIEKKQKKEQQYREETKETNKNKNWCHSPLLLYL